MREFAVPIDSTVRRTSFTFSFDTPGNTVTLYRPSGDPIAPEEQGVQGAEWRCGRMVILRPPEAGTWRLRLQGSGRFWGRVLAESDISFVDVEFVGVGGRPGHQGLIRIPGQPLPGRPETLRVNLSGRIRTTGFKLVSMNGKP